jgi:putative YphP/YqiW family bacilliredoxin
MKDEYSILEEKVRIQRSNLKHMPYPEMMISGMRQELAQLGIEETKTPEAVEEAVKNTDGTLMVVVNSVCGCAAGGVRPGIAMALQQSENKPDKAITVFAGADIDATDKARDFFAGYAPSSPSIGLLKNGELVKLFERRDLEGRPPQVIAEELANAFQQYCTADAAEAAANN